MKSVTPQSTAVQMSMEPKSEAYIVAEMRILNKAAKDLPKTKLRKFIYDLKDELTTLLYKRGNAVSVGQSVQVVSCDHIDMVDGFCRDCQGSGSYAKNRMYVYDFQVGEYRFVWHQPVARCRVTPNLYGTVRDERSVYLRIPETSLNDLLFDVWFYLNIHGCAGELKLFEEENEFITRKRALSFWE